MLRMLRMWQALHSMDRSGDRLIWNRVWRELQRVADDPIQFMEYSFVCAFSQRMMGQVFYLQNHGCIDWAYGLVQLLPPLRCPSCIWVPDNPWNPETNSTAYIVASTGSSHSCEKKNKLLLSPIAPASKSIPKMGKLTISIYQMLGSLPW